MTQTPESNELTPAEQVKEYVANYFQIDPEVLVTQEVEKAEILYVKVKERDSDREWIMGCTSKLVSKVLLEYDRNISDLDYIFSEDTDMNLGIRNALVKAILKEVDYIRGTIYSTMLEDESSVIEELGLKTSPLIKVSRSDGDTLWKNRYGDPKQLHSQMVGGMSTAFYSVNPDVSEDPVLVVL